MAELGTPPPFRTGRSLTRQQMFTIAWLRWRILANSMRRRGGAAEMVLRILLLPVMFALGLLPAAVAGGAAWYLLHTGDARDLSFVFWGAFLLTQLLNINLGQPGTTFDPGELIRFPLRFRNYVFIRLCFGLLSPANVVVTLISVAVFLGVTLADHTLLPWALLATSGFALANVLFSRMAFAWVDRWLSTRRAREIFTTLIFVFSLGFQYINVTYNPGFQHGHRVPSEKLHRAAGLLRTFHPWLRFLPPELSSMAIVHGLQRRPEAALLSGALVYGYAAVFLLVYAWRMQTEHRGEALSDEANLVRKPLPARPHTAQAGMTAPAEDAQMATAAWSPEQAQRAALPALLGKELLVLRRNTGLLYGVVAPMVMVFLFAGRMSLRGGSQWVALLAVGYALLSLAPVSYNSLGLEGPGAQLYFFAPLRLRDVFLAKNLLQFALAALETLAVIAVVSYVARGPGAPEFLFLLLWAAATCLLNTSLGNLRSISAPKKISAGKSFNRAQSQVSAWIAIGVLVASTAVAAGVQWVSLAVHQGWLGPTVMACVAGGSLLVYRLSLRGLDAYAMERREAIFEELGKKT